MAETKKYRSLEQLKEIHDLIILFFFTVRGNQVLCFLEWIVRGFGLEIR
jgi:hypothetical protein